MNWIEVLEVDPVFQDLLRVRSNRPFTAPPWTGEMGIDDFRKFWDVERRVLVFGVIPEVDDSVAFDGGVAARPSIGGDTLAVWNFHATPVPRPLPSVEGALQRRPNNFSSDSQMCTQVWAVSIE